MESVVPFAGSEAVPFVAAASARLPDTVSRETKLDGDDGNDNGEGEGEIDDEGDGGEGLVRSALGSRQF